MSKSAQKIPISIYQIDRSEFGNTNCLDVADIIIYNTNASRNPEFQFIPQALIQNDFGEFKVKIYHAVNYGLPKWSSFFVNVVSPGENMFEHKNVECSFIAFVVYKDELYAASGGQGNFTLERYAVQNFGMEILVRLIERNEKVIKKLKERGVTGNVLGQIKLFRGDQRFSEEDQFGKVYREIDAELNKEILVDTFGFSKRDLRRSTSGCLAKDSFKINKRISFESLLSIISRTTTILERDRNFSLNRIIQINKRSINGKELINELDDCFKATLYDLYKKKEISQFDFFHKKFEEYYKASSYIVTDGRRELHSYSRYINVDDLIFDRKRKGQLLDDNIDLFRISFLDLIIETFDEDGVRLTSDTILNHFHGEIIFNDKTYFRIDGEWYRVKEDFISDLNRDCKECLEQIWDDQLLTRIFDVKRKEREYNFSYINDPNFLVLDTVTYENIEFCDLIKYDNDFVHLIHVKKGFNNSIRELTNQIAISARRFAEDRKNGYSFAENIEIKAKKGKKDPNVFTQKIANQKFPAAGLKKILNKRDSQIIFCLAFVDTANDRETIKEDIASFKSTIAKYCILELRSYVQSLNFSLKVIQLIK